MCQLLLKLYKQTNFSFTLHVLNDHQTHLHKTAVCFSDSQVNSEFRVKYESTDRAITVQIELNFVVSTTYQQTFEAACIS